MADKGILLRADASPGMGTGHRFAVGTNFAPPQRHQVVVPRLSVVGVDTAQQAQVVAAYATTMTKSKKRGVYT